VNLEQARDKLAAALKKAAAEHRLPNSFSCRELEELYGGPPRLLAGRIGKRYRRALQMALGVDWDLPEYQDGIFKVRLRG
jgi:hypothetical protein